MPRQLTLNSTNVVPGQFANTYDYIFPSAQKFEAGDAIALAGCNMYYALFNISAALGNNSFDILWPQASGVAYNQFTVTFPDGQYSINELNDYLQFYFIQNGYYLIDANGDYVYFMELTANFNYYKFQFTMYPVPTSLPSGFTQPSNWVNYSAANLTPRVFINSNIWRNIGFAFFDTFPNSGNTAVYSNLSPLTPQITDQNTFLVRCSLIQNKNASVLNDIFYAFSPNAPFGSFLSLNLDKLIFNSITPGYYDRLRITFVDQRYRPLRLIDNNVLITLIIHKHSEEGDLID